MNLALQFLTRCIYFKQNISSFFMLRSKVCYSENVSKPITTELKIYYKPNQCFSSLKFEIIYLIQRSFTRNTFRIIKQKFPSAYSFLLLFCSFFYSLVMVKNIFTRLQLIQSTNQQENVGVVSHSRP